MNFIFLFTVIMKSFADCFDTLEKVYGELINVNVSSYQFKLI